MCYKTGNGAMTRKKRTISQGIRAYLREGIISGRFKPGMYMPSERVLAEELNVSKSSIHINLERLQEEGLVQLHHGRGALVCQTTGDRRFLNRFFLRPSDFGTYSYLSGASGLIQGVCYGAEVKGAEILMSFSDATNVADEIIMHHNSGLIQGVIYLHCADKEIMKPFEKAGIPYIVAWDEEMLDVPGIRVDVRETARRAIRYLAAHGHRKIGLLNGDAKRALYHEFAAGFRGAIAEEELETRPEWNFTISNLAEEKIKFKRNRSELLEFMQRDKQDLPTAFFCARDYRAEVFYNVCHELNYSIPKDFSVIGFDNNTWKDSGMHGLTSFAEPLHEQGEAAVDMLSQWIKSGKQPENRMLNCNLVERSSVASI